MHHIKKINRTFFIMKLVLNIFVDFFFGIMEINARQCRIKNKFSKVSQLVFPEFFRGLCNFSLKLFEVSVQFFISSFKNYF